MDRLLESIARRRLTSRCRTISRVANARSSASSPWAAAIPRFARPGSPCERGIPPITACSRFPVRRSSGSFLIRARVLFRRGAEPRCAASFAADPRNVCSKRQVAIVLVYGGFPLSAATSWRESTRQKGGYAMPSIAKPIATHPSAAAKRAGADHSRLRRVHVHAVRRLRTRFHHRRDRSRAVGDLDTRRTWWPN